MDKFIFKPGDEVIANLKDGDIISFVKKVEGNKVFLESGEVVLMKNVARNPVRKGGYCRKINGDETLYLKDIKLDHGSSMARVKHKCGKEEEVMLIDLVPVKPSACKCNGKCGCKNDRKDGKVRWELVPMPEIEDIAKLFTIGAEKYHDNSWKELEGGFERYRAALLRHMTEYMKGERFDEETGINHIVAVAWNAVAMLWFDKEGKGLYEGKCPGWMDPKMIKKISEEMERQEEVPEEHVLVSPDMKTREPEPLGTKEGKMLATVLEFLKEIGYLEDEENNIKVTVLKKEEEE